MAATTFRSVIIVFWKETAFPRWRDMDIIIIIIIIKLRSSTHYTIGIFGIQLVAQLLA